MGLERVAAVLQGVISNYDTDLFVPLMKRAAELCGVDFAREEKIEEGTGGAASLRVIADHARATTFLIADGVIPSNEGRGYVLRKIIRRAIQHVRNLGSNSFFFPMVGIVCDLMKGAYPELKESYVPVTNVLEHEEKHFYRTFWIGFKKLNEELARTLSNLVEEPDNKKALLEAAAANSRADLDQAGLALQQLRTQAGENLSKAVTIIASLANRILAARASLSVAAPFHLYDTYGLQRDFIEDACRDFAIEAAWERSTAPWGTSGRK